MPRYLTADELAAMTYGQFWATVEQNPPGAVCAAIDGWVGLLSVTDARKLYDLPPLEPDADAPTIVGGP